VATVHVECGTDIVVMLRNRRRRGSKKAHKLNLLCLGHLQIGSFIHLTGVRLCLVMVKVGSATMKVNLFLQSQVVKTLTQDSLNWVTCIRVPSL
jgi:hypothetical protein